MNCSDSPCLTQNYEPTQPDPRSTLDFVRTAVDGIAAVGIAACTPSGQLTHG